jgi:hypothetical protein
MFFIEIALEKFLSTDLAHRTEIRRLEEVYRIIVYK